MSHLWLKRKTYCRPLFILTRSVTLTDWWLIDFFERSVERRESSVSSLQFAMDASSCLHELIRQIHLREKHRGRWAPRLLTLEKNFYLFCAVTHVSMLQHLNLDAADASYSYQYAQSISEILLRLPDYVITTLLIQAGALKRTVVTANFLLSIIQNKGWVSKSGTIKAPTEMPQYHQYHKMSCHSCTQFRYLGVNFINSSEQICIQYAQRTNT